MFPYILKKSCVQQNYFIAVIYRSFISEMGQFFLVRCASRCVPSVFSRSCTCLVLMMVTLNSKRFFLLNYIYSKRPYVQSTISGSINTTLDTAYGEFFAVVNR